MEGSFDVEKDLYIDKYQLDKECLSNASVYYRYLQASGQADIDVSEAKDKLKVVMGEAQLRIREACNNEGKKVTEGLISSMVDCDSGVIEAQEELRQCQETSVRLNAAVKAMEVKKSSLDNLVKLYCAGYYSAVQGSNKIDPVRQNQMEQGIRAQLAQGDNK